LGGQSRVRGHDVPSPGSPGSAGDASRRLTMARTPTLPPRDLIADDTPLRLDIAAALAYPDGSMTASGLREEAGGGRLVTERTAGKDYTTLAAIEDMRALCRVPQKASVSGFAPKTETPMAHSASARFGSSEMDRAKSARAALQKIARAPSEPSGSTSPPSTSPIESAAVIRPRS